MEPSDLRNRLNESIRFFRLGMEAHGSDRLRRVIDLLLVELPKLSETEYRDIQICLSQVLAAQERRDFLLVADLLEFQIAPLFSTLQNKRENDLKETR